MLCLIIIIVTVSFVFIIDEQVVIFMPVAVAYVKGDIGFLEIDMVVFKRYVEDTIVRLGECKGLLHFLRDTVPFFAIITPGSFVSLSAPRVP